MTYKEKLQHAKKLATELKEVVISIGDESVKQKITNGVGLDDLEETLSIRRDLANSTRGTVSLLQKL